MSGWIKLHRKSLDHPLLHSALRQGVWSKLLMMAAHEPTTITFRGHRLSLGRGQLAVVLTDFAKTLGLTRKQLRICVDSWRSAGMLSTGQAKGHAFTIISISNYAEYQAADKREGPSHGQSRGQAGAKQGPTEQEPKEPKEKIQTSSVAADADDAPEPEPDLRKLIFDRGLALLKRQGKQDRPSRSFIAKMCKQHSDGAVFAAIAEIERVGAKAEIQSALAEAAQRHGSKRGPPGRQGYTENLADTVDMIRELEADDDQFQHRALH